MYCPKQNINIEINEKYTVSALPELSFTSFLDNDAKLVAMKMIGNVLLTINIKLKKITMNLKRFLTLLESDLAVKNSGYVLDMLKKFIFLTSSLMKKIIFGFCVR